MSAAVIDVLHHALAYTAALMLPLSGVATIVAAVADAFKCRGR